MNEVQRTGDIKNYGQYLHTIPFSPGFFRAFTHSHSQIDKVVKYINGQEQHHKKKTFKEEYLEILNKNDIRFKDEYLFDFFEDFPG